MSQGVKHRVLAPKFAHLMRLTDRRGVLGCAQNSRDEHGYCTENVARALIVVLREPRRAPALDLAIEIYLSFLERAVCHNGSVYHHMSASGSWTDGPSTGECWGRTISALAHATRFGTTKSIRGRAMRAFLRAAKARSFDVRAACFAATGAVALVRTRTEASGPARFLLTDCLDVIPRRPCPGWDWPEPRMTYANAALCDALIIGGAALGHANEVRQGLSMLTVLLRIETSESGHLSPTGTQGRSPGQSGPLWPQQPSEAASIADACSHAFALTGDLSWRRGVELAWGWFGGDNDAGVAIYAPGTGAGHDRLEPHGRNENRGAEGTLAALSTLQRLREISTTHR